MVLLACLGLARGEDITVSLAKGKIRGARLDYDFGQYYYAFKGVPYARPPVKELRFKVGPGCLVPQRILRYYRRTHVRPPKVTNYGADTRGLGRCLICWSVNSPYRPQSRMAECGRCRWSSSAVWHLVLCGQTLQPGSSVPEMTATPHLCQRSTSLCAADCAARHCAHLCKINYAVYTQMLKYTNTQILHCVAQMEILP